MTTRIKHIPNPTRGWYLCGYIPRQLPNGQFLVRPIDPDDTVQTCQRCEAIRRRRQITDAEVYAADSDLLGRPSPLDPGLATE